MSLGGFNGATDGTAINAKLAALGGPGTLILPGGTGIIDTKVLLDTGQNLFYPGFGACTLKAKNGLNDDVIQTVGFAGLTGGTTQGGPSAFGLFGFTIDGNKANQSGTSWPLRIYGSNYKVGQLQIQNGLSGGAWSEWGNGGSNMEAHWSNYKIVDCNNDGLHWDGPHDSAHVNASIIRATGHGVNVVSGKAAGTEFTNVHAWGTQMTGWSWHISSGVYLIACQGEGAQAGQIWIGGSDVDIKGGHFFASGGGAIGMQLGDVSNFVSWCNIDTKVSDAITPLNVANDAGYNNLKLLARMAHPPTNLAVSASGSGSAFGAGAQFWQVTAILPGGETVACQEATATLTAGQNGVLTWTPATGTNLSGYKVYRSTTTGGESTSPALVATLGVVAGYTDTGTAVSAGNVPAFTPITGSLQDSTKLELAMDTAGQSVHEHGGQMRIPASVQITRSSATALDIKNDAFTTIVQVDTSAAPAGAIMKVQTPAGLTADCARFLNKDGVQVLAVSDTGPMVNANNTAVHMRGTSGRTLFDMADVTSAVNQVKVTNAITGGAPGLVGQGTDSNVDVGVQGKGTGGLKLPTGGGALGGRIYSGSGAPVFSALAGDFFLRTDTPSTANQRIYVCTGTTTWVGIV